MKDEKATVEDLKIIINTEGIGYAIQYYISAKEIEDKELARLWKRAKKLLDLIEQRIRDKIEDATTNF